MTLTDYVLHLILSVFLIVGVYQFYFWCQRAVVKQPCDLSGKWQTRQCMLFVLPQIPLCVSGSTSLWHRSQSAGWWQAAQLSRSMRAAIEWPRRRQWLLCLSGASCMWQRAQVVSEWHR